MKVRKHITGARTDAEALTEALMYLPSGTYDCITIKGTEGQATIAQMEQKGLSLPQARWIAATDRESSDALVVHIYDHEADSELAPFGGPKIVGPGVKTFCISTGA